MDFIDAHCHLADPRFDDSRQEVIHRAQRKGITTFVQGGVDPEDWLRQQQHSENNNWILSFGLHPWYVNQTGDTECKHAFAQLQSQLHKASALGELGLDHGPRMDKMAYPKQEKWFRQQLLLAQERDLPLILHLVRAHGPALNILREHGKSWRGMVHGFTGSTEVAEAYLDLGLHISVGGAVARPGYKKLKSALDAIPAARLLVESDAPDMAPAGYDRPHNEPETLWQVALALGELRNQEPAEILTQSRDNLRAIFGLEQAS